MLGLMRTGVHVTFILTCSSQHGKLPGGFFNVRIHTAQRDRSGCSLTFKPAAWFDQRYGHSLRLHTVIMWQFYFCLHTIIWFLTGLFGASYNRTGGWLQHKCFTTEGILVADVCLHERLFWILLCRYDKRNFFFHLQVMWETDFFNLFLFIIS